MKIQKRSLSILLTAVLILAALPIHIAPTAQAAEPYLAEYTGEITIAMYDEFGDGWTTAAITVMVNGVDVGPAKLEESSYEGIFKFNVVEGDTIELLWIVGSYDEECAFIMYYTDSLTEEDVENNFDPGEHNDFCKSADVLTCQHYNDLSGVEDGGVIFPHDPRPTYWTDAGIRAEDFADSTLDDTLLIANEAEFGLYAYLTNGGWGDYEGAAYDFDSETITVRLTADLDLSAHLWEPVEGFFTTFDGGGYAISSLRVDDQKGFYESAGLFSYLESCVVRDLTLDSPSLDVISGEIRAGALAGRAMGSYIHDVTVLNPSVSVDLDDDWLYAIYAGGVVGRATELDFGDPHPDWNDTKTVINGVDVIGGSVSVTLEGEHTSYVYIGGIAGTVELSGVTSCSVTGTAVAGDDGSGSGSEDTALALGGIAGYTSADYFAQDSCLLNNLFAGTLSVTADETSSASVEADWAGTVTGDAVGGIAGAVLNDNVLNNLYIGEDFECFGAVTDDTEEGDDGDYLGDNENYNYQYDTAEAAIADGIYEALTDRTPGSSYDLALDVTTAHRTDGVAVANTKYRGWEIGGGEISLGWWNVNIPAADVEWEHGETVSLPTAPSGAGEVNTAASAGTGYWQVSNAGGAWVTVTDETVANYTAHNGMKLRYALPYAYGDKTGYSNAVNIVIEEPVMVNLEGTVTISGTARYGETLTATPDVTSTAPGTLSYQWHRDGNPISGAESTTYTLTADDVGSEITVSVSAANYAGSLISGETAEVSKARLTPSIDFTGVSGKTYDGTAEITGTQPTITLTGAVNSETPAATAAFAFANANAGANKGVNATNITLDAAFTDRYELTVNVLNNATSVLEIERALITGAVVTLGAELTYTGEAQTQTVASVVLNGKTLTAGTDYEVSGNMQTDAGDYTLTVTGVGNYTGTVEKTFTIGEAALIPEAKPQAAIDYINETLTGLTAGTYSFNGGADVAVTATTIPINPAWFGTTLSIVKKGDGAATADSAAQSLAIPSPPAAPSGVGKTDTSNGNSNGTLTGVTSAMEYRRGTSSWTAITGTTVTNLRSGTYHVRYEATPTSFASASVSLTIASSEAPYNPPPTPPRDDDDTTIPGNNGAVQVDYAEDDGEVALELPASKIDELIDSAEDGVANIDISGIEDADRAIFDVDAAENFLNAETAVTMIFPDAEVTLDLDALFDISETTDIGTTPVTVAASDVPMKDLKGLQAAQVKGYETVVNIDIFVGDEKVDVPVTVSLPYTLKANENPNAVRVWHLDDDGKLTRLNGVYNEETGMITFTVEHQSYFVVGYDPVALWENIFRDIAPNDWFYDAVAYANYYGYVDGNGTGNYNPFDHFSRATFVTLIWKLEGNPVVGRDDLGTPLAETNGTSGENTNGTSGENTNGTPGSSSPTFSDVPDGMWYTDAVYWAAEQGIVTGTGNGFNPSKLISRQEMITLLYNYLRYKGYDIPVNQDAEYEDSGLVDAWAESAVKALADAGVLSGFIEETLNPEQNTNRAELAQIFMDFLRLVAGK